MKYWHCFYEKVLFILSSHQKFAIQIHNEAMKNFEAIDATHLPHTVAIHNF